MSKKIHFRKVFGCGRITLPKAWRTWLEVAQVLIEDRGGHLVIFPLRVEMRKTETSNPAEQATAG